MLHSQTIKIIEENIGSKISDIACNDILSYISSQARDKKEKLNKWDYIKIKSFGHKGSHQRNKKTTHRMGEHTC